MIIIFPFYLFGGVHLSSWEQRPIHFFLSFFFTRNELPGCNGSYTIKLSLFTRSCLTPVSRSRGFGNGGIFTSYQLGSDADSSWATDMELEGGVPPRLVAWPGLAWFLRYHFFSGPASTQLRCSFWLLAAEVWTRLKSCDVRLGPLKLKLTLQIFQHDPGKNDRNFNPERVEAVPSWQMYLYARSSGESVVCQLPLSLKRRTPCMWNLLRRGVKGGGVVLVCALPLTPLS